MFERVFDNVGIYLLLEDNPFKNAYKHKKITSKKKSLNPSEKHKKFEWEFPHIAKKT